MAWAEHVARMGRKKYACRVLVGKPERTRSFERPRRRWKENIEVPPSSENSSELQLVFQWILKNISCTERKLRVSGILFDFILFILTSKNKTKKSRNLNCKIIFIWVTVMSVTNNSSCYEN